MEGSTLDGTHISHTLLPKARREFQKRDRIIRTRGLDDHNKSVISRANRVVEYMDFQKL